MRTTIAALALLAAAPAAATTVIYNNGAPDNNSGNEATGWVQTEDFSFASATKVGGAGVYLAGFDGIGNWDGKFQYYLFDSNSGKPGSILQTGSVDITPTDTGTAWSFGGNAYLFAFNFASAFNAAAGATYHLGIHAGAPGDFDPTFIYWVTTGGNGSATGLESLNGTFDNWIGNKQEHAFYLTASAVPEPGTWAMMILGFGAVGSAMRRQRMMPQAA